MATRNVASRIDPNPNPNPIPVGGFFSDFAGAMDDYAKDYVSLSIVSVAVVTGTGSAINENEVAKFKVRVNNGGHLDLTDVRVHIEGQNGADVSDDAAGPWSGSVFTSGRPVDAHDYADGAYFYFKAPAAASGSSVTLVRAHMSIFDAKLSHLMNDHTIHSDPPAGTYSTEVHPA